MFSIFGARATSTVTLPELITVSVVNRPSASSTATASVVKSILLIPTTSGRSAQTIANDGGAILRGCATTPTRARRGAAACCLRRAAAADKGSARPKPRGDRHGRRVRRGRLFRTDWGDRPDAGGSPQAAEHRTPPEAIRAVSDGETGSMTRYTRGLRLLPALALILVLFQPRDANAAFDSAISALQDMVSDFFNNLIEPLTQSTV